MNRIIINIFGISSAIVISVCVKKLYNIYNFNLNDKYILDCLRIE
jgi:hypothetical protein